MGQHDIRSQEGVSLKEYMDHRFAELQRALDKAERDLSIRLSGTDELRETLKDQANLFVTREQLDLKLDALQRDVNGLMLTRAETKGKASQSGLIFSYVVATAGIVLAAAALLMSSGAL